MKTQLIEFSKPDKILQLFESQQIQFCDQKFGEDIHKTEGIARSLFPYLNIN